MNFKLMKKGDYLVDTQGQIKEYVGSCNIKEKRDGQDFTYPGCMLKDIYSEEVMVVPQFQIDLDFVLVHPEVCGLDKEDSSKAADFYLKAFEAATKQQFTKEYSSKFKGQYQTLTASCQILASSYGNMYMTKTLPPATQELLQNFALYLLLHIEISTARKKEEEKKE